MPLEPIPGKPYIPLFCRFFTRTLGSQMDKVKSPSGNRRPPQLGDPDPVEDAGMDFARRLEAYQRR